MTTTGWELEGEALERRPARAYGGAPPARRAGRQGVGKRIPELEGGALEPEDRTRVRRCALWRAAPRARAPANGSRSSRAEPSIPDWRFRRTTLEWGRFPAVR